MDWMRRLRELISSISWPYFSWFILPDSVKKKVFNTRCTSLTRLKRRIASTIQNNSQIWFKINEKTYGASCFLYYWTFTTCLDYNIVWRNLGRLKGGCKRFVWIISQSFFRFSEMSQAFWDTLHFYRTKHSASLLKVFCHSFRVAEVLTDL